LNDEQQAQIIKQQNKKEQRKVQEEEDMNFFQELYAGINNMFENVYDEAADANEQKIRDE